MSKPFSCHNEFDKNKLLCTVNSLEQFGVIKNRLDLYNIKYSEKTYGNHRMLLFIYQILFRSQAIYGLNGEHDMNYSIYVDVAVYEQAKITIIDLL